MTAVAIESQGGLRAGRSIEGIVNAAPVTVGSQGGLRAGRSIEVIVSRAGGAGWLEVIAVERAGGGVNGRSLWQPRRLGS